MRPIDAARDQLERAKSAVRDGRWTPLQLDDDPTIPIERLEAALSQDEPAQYLVDHWSDRLAETYHCALEFDTVARRPDDACATATATT